MQIVKLIFSSIEILTYVIERGFYLNISINQILPEI